MRLAVIAITLLAGSVFAQVPPGQLTPFDAPVLENIASPDRILTTIEAAKEHIFLVIPGLDSPALLETLGKQAERIPVYVVMSDGKASMAGELSQYGVQVRLINNTAEGVMLVDYEDLFVGGLISGTESRTLFVDLGAYGNDTMIQQMQVLWQAAKPFGEQE